MYPLVGSAPTAPQVPAPGGAAQTDLILDKSGKPFKDRTINLAVANSIKRGKNVEAVQIGPNQWGMRPVVDEGPKVDFESMIQEAARWRGAALKAAEAAEGDKRAALRISRMTTKGDLDDYLMRKFGLDSAAARDVSNALTARDIPADVTASLKEFSGEPWAQAVANDPAETPGRVYGDTVYKLNQGDRLKDASGKEYAFWSQRHGVMEVHPVENGSRSSTLTPACVSM